MLPTAGTMKMFQHPEALVGQWLREVREGEGQHKDVSLVCDDGTLAWSSLLLASKKVPALADSLRTLDRCSFCVQQTVVLLPGRRYKDTICLLQRHWNPALTFI